jgi:hypothetical protein
MVDGPARCLVVNLLAGYLAAEAADEVLAEPVEALRGLKGEAEVESLRSPRKGSAGS